MNYYVFRPAGGIRGCEVLHVSAPSLLTENQVLEAIYPSELSSSCPIILSYSSFVQHSCKVISDRQIEIDVEPDVVVDGAEPCEPSDQISRSQPNLY